jgi:hypothetical protein
MAQRFCFQTVNVLYCTSSDARFFKKKKVREDYTHITEVRL